MIKTTSRSMAFASLAALVMVTAPVTSALAAAPVEIPGELTIYSTTTGAVVEIDGKSVGKLPFDDSLMVTPGVHKIRVVLRGWTEYIDTFEVSPGEEVELEIDLIPFAGIVKVNTKEPGASVKIDGKVEGVTPFDKDITVGKKLITVSRPGYYDETRTVVIKAGEHYDINIELRAVPGAGKVAIYEEWWFWTLIGVAGAGAATAVALSSGGETPPPTASFTLQVP